MSATITLSLTTAQVETIERLTGKGVSGVAMHEIDDRIAVESCEEYTAYSYAVFPDGRYTGQRRALDAEGWEALETEDPQYAGESPWEVEL